MTGLVLQCLVYSYTASTTQQTQTFTIKQFRYQIGYFYKPIKCEFVINKY